MDTNLLPFMPLETIVSMPNRIEKYKNIMVSCSGGSDSDVIIDLVCRSLKNKNNVSFVFFDTGLEFEATKTHLDFLEEKYGIEIYRIKTIKPIPLAVRQHGQPFMSKHITEMIDRLQRHGFKWEDDCYDNLVKKYPNCQSALKWWCNEYEQNSLFNIKRKKLLREFMISNPPKFKISNACCKYNKKDVAREYKKQNNIDLSITGMRKAEGGARAAAYKGCFTTKNGKADEYRPIWLFSDKDKKEYTEVSCIVNSDCYEVYGMKRTGCAGCPMGIFFEKELKILEEYEPKLFKAANKVFKDSYEYTRQYVDYVKSHENKKIKKEKDYKNGIIEGQLSFEF